MSSLTADPAELWGARLSGVPQLWARYTNLVIDRGEGSWLITTDGERYLDYTSGIAVTNTGHAHPRVAAAIAEQATKAAPRPAEHRLPPARSASCTSGCRATSRGTSASEVGVFLSNSGAEAIEASIKLAKMATRRPLVIAFHGGFHGRTHAAMALTSFRASSTAVTTSHCRAACTTCRSRTRCEYGGGEARRALARDDARDRAAVRDDGYPDDVAAFIVEPILGEGGYVIPPDSFLPALREVADRHGILLITDEIQTGYGRTGQFFASEWTGAVPDIVVMAKGIASGLPLSGIMARRSLIDRSRRRAHGGTYGGNVVACAAALATLDVIEDEGLVANAERQGERLLAGLRSAATGVAGVADVRGRGLMVAIEFADPETRSRHGPTWPRSCSHEAFERKLLLLTCGTYGKVVRVIPPLVTTDAEVDQAIDIISESLATL